MGVQLDAWKAQAPQMLSSFRRDFALATQEADIHELVDELKRGRQSSKRDVHTGCNGTRKLMIEGKVEPFEHASLTIGADRH